MVSENKKGTKQRLFFFFFFLGVCARAYKDTMLDDKRL